MQISNIWLLPGWQNSDPAHWQSLWQQSQGYHRVEQHDWMRPLRGDWLARLDEQLLDHDAHEVVLVAHSLGCQLVSFWAGHSQQTRRVKAALLVAPPDTEQLDVQTVLPNWAPIRLQALPFPSIVVASQDDPYCRFARSQQIAQAWGAQLIDLGPRGHINTESQLGSWPQGLALVQQLQTQP